MTRGVTILKKTTTLILLFSALFGAIFAELPLLSAEPAANPAQAGSLEFVKKLVDSYNAGDHSWFVRNSNKAMLDAVPPDKWQEFVKEYKAAYGAINRTSFVKKSGPADIYEFWFDKGSKTVTLVLDGEGKIAGILFADYVPPIPTPERNSTPLVLPFEGRWLTLWGGDSIEVNQHAAVQNQRHAFDFVAVDEKGSTFRNDGARNEDYYCFGREIRSPAKGTVTDVIVGVRDNAPRSMNGFSALGNAVFIQHADYEVSILAHLAQSSVKVKVGDKVEAGTSIGLCGNSGNSSEPHLHYHLQNTPIIQDGTGIKCYFKNLVLVKSAQAESEQAGAARTESAGAKSDSSLLKNSSQLKEFSPVKGDLIEPADGL
jgi:hypothetical protein